MEFPTTSILDDFNRANENPLSGGGNWTISGTFDAPWQLLSNGVIGTSGANENQMAYSAAGDLTDCEAYATVVTVPTAGNVVGVICRQDPSVNTGKNYYDCLYVAGTGILIDYYDSTGTTHTLATYAQVVNVGDSIGLSVIGTTLTAWYKASGGSWVSLGSVTDTNLSHGYIGITGFPLFGGGKLDDFGGGVPVPNGDATTITSITSPSASELGPGVDSNIISSTTTVTSNEATPYIEATTVRSATSLLGSYLIESLTLHTTDYGFNIWTIPFTFDGSIPTVGSVGTFDNDHGYIPGT
jgi:hypothetical protein